MVDTSVTSSGHFPVILSLVDPILIHDAPPKAKPPARLIWKSRDAETFSKYADEDISESLCYNTDDATDEMYDKLCKAIWAAARLAGIVHVPRETSGPPDRITKKPWFDDICLAKKKEKDDALKIARRFEFCEPFLDRFVECKNNYNLVKNERKKLFEQSLRDKLANVRNAADFWAAVRSLRISRYSPGLPVEIWN